MSNDEKTRVIVRTSAGFLSDAGPLYAVIKIGSDLAHRLLGRIALFTAMQEHVHGIEWEAPVPKWFSNLYDSDIEFAYEIEKALSEQGYYVMGERESLDWVIFQKVECRMKVTAGEVWWSGHWGGSVQLDTTAIPAEVLEEIAGSAGEHWSLRVVIWATQALFERDGGSWLDNELALLGILFDRIYELGDEYTARAEGKPRGSSDHEVARDLTAAMRRVDEAIESIQVAQNEIMLDNLG